MLNGVLFAKTISAQYSTVGDPPYPPFNYVCGNDVLEPGEECEPNLNSLTWRCQEPPSGEIISGCNGQDIPNQELWCKCRHVPGPTVQPECNDGIDNDNDGGIDYDGKVTGVRDRDIQCTNANDRSESDSEPTPRPGSGPSNQPPSTPPPICPLQILEETSTYSVGAQFSGSIEAKATINPGFLTNEEIQKTVEVVNKVKNNEPFIEKIKKIPNRGAIGFIASLFPSGGDAYDELANEKTTALLKGKNFKKSKVPVIDPSPKIIDLEKTLIAGDLDLTFKSSKDQSRSSSFGCYLPETLKLRLDYNSYSDKSEISPLTPMSIRLWIISDLEKLFLDISSQAYGISSQSNIGAEFNKLIEQTLKLPASIYRINSQLIKGDLIIKITTAEGLDDDILLKIANKPKTGTTLDSQTIENIKTYLKDKYILTIHEDLTASYLIGNQVTEKPIWDTILENAPIDRYYIITQEAFGSIVTNLIAWFNEMPEENHKSSKYIVVNAGKKEDKGTVDITAKINKPNLDLITDLINACCGREMPASQPASRPAVDLIQDPTLVYGLEPTMDPSVILAGYLALSSEEVDREVAPMIICYNTNLCNA